MLILWGKKNLFGGLGIFLVMINYKFLPLWVMSEASTTIHIKPFIYYLQLIQLNKFSCIHLNGTVLIGLDSWSIKGSKIKNSTLTDLWVLYQWNGSYCVLAASLTVGLWQCVCIVSKSPFNVMHCLAIYHNLEYRRCKPILLIFFYLLLLPLVQSSFFSSTFFLASHFLLSFLFLLQISPGFFCFHSWVQGCVIRSLDLSLASVCSCSQTHVGGIN